VAGSMTCSRFHSPDWRIWPGRAWCPLQLGLGGSWPAASWDVSAMLFRSTYPVGAGSRDAEAEHRHCADVSGSPPSRARFLASPAWMGAAAVEPGLRAVRVAAPSRWMSAAPACHRKAEAQWLPLPVALGQVPAVLP
jgi:hypothetical protein